MHKKLEAELIHLAHKILKINNQTSISELRDKARIIYENLSVLSFIDDYFVETPDVTDNKEDFLEKLNSLTSNKIVNKKIEEKPKVVEKVVEKTLKTNIVEEKPQINLEAEQKEKEQLVQQTVKTIKSEAKEIAAKLQETTVKDTSAFANEMKDSIPADVAADMFEKAPVFTPKEEIVKKAETFSAFAPNRKAATENLEEELIKDLAIENKTKVERPKVNVAVKQEVSTPTPSAPASLNDRISNQKIQVGLNDRIAFVKHLFNFSQEEFNRVLSQLNTFSSEKDCKDFIYNQVKPDYDWSDKEEYEARLISLIERKFK